MKIQSINEIMQNIRHEVVRKICKELWDFYQAWYGVELNEYNVTCIKKGLEFVKNKYYANDFAKNIVAAFEHELLNPINVRETDRKISVFYDKYISRRINCNTVKERQMLRRELDKEYEKLLYSVPEGEEYKLHEIYICLVNTFKE